MAQPISCRSHGKRSSRCTAPIFMTRNMTVWRTMPLISSTSSNARTSSSRRNYKVKARTYLRLGFYRLQQQINTEVERTIKTIGSIDEEQVRTLVREKAVDFLAELEKCKDLPGFTQDDVTKCGAKCEKDIRDTIEDVFEKLPVQECNEQLQHAGSLILCKRFARRDYSGVVIAGYGERDVFPSLLAYQCECVINNKLRYIETTRVKIGTGKDRVLAWVGPFAQREMVNRF